MVPSILRHSAITFESERHETVLASHLVKREPRIQPVVSLHLSKKHTLALLLGTRPPARMKNN
jgi:hypothetical protein